MLIKHNAAAASPGPLRPQWLAIGPSAGPSATPAFVAADSQPRALARSSGPTESATYAWITLTVPPPAPCTRRDRNSSQSDVAKPKMTYAIADADRPMSNAGRRP